MMGVTCLIFSHQGHIKVGGIWLGIDRSPDLGTTTLPRKQGNICPLNEGFDAPMKQLYATIFTCQSTPMYLMAKKQK